ncbi:hypothetical protein [Paenibacillus alkalitolerans]|uniref:hypothetical protein n=1 Tax=Paenibacillus alkalitolerans TaxID=2799335 RepID=UPI0018F4F681|nr:hypothetical protein [Paenibacillus alkalitolerans]
MTKSGPAATNYNAIYFFALFAPALFALLMAVIPDWSPGIGTVVFTVVLLNVLLVLVLKLTRAIERSPKRRVLFFISEMNLLVACLLGIVWRSWGAGPVLAVGLLLLNVIVAYIGYRYRRTIFQEVLYPRTRAGKIIFAAGLIGGGVAGSIGYGLSQLFSDHFPDMLPFFITLVFVPVSIYILLVVYSGWIKAEDPNWEPDTRPVRRRNGRTIKK